MLGVVFRGGIHEYYHSRLIFVSLRGFWFGRCAAMEERSMWRVLYGFLFAM